MENEKLPALVTQIDAEMAKQDKEENIKLVKTQQYTKLLNNLPEKEKLQEHAIVKGVFYLPISFMEMTLDELFFGQWKTSQFEWKQVGNEIAGSILVEVFHPISKMWLSRVGAAAHQIPVDAIDPEVKKTMTKVEINQWALNLGHKKPGGLDNGAFASFKAECFRNACLGLGKYFGRDVNRKFTDQFSPVVAPTDERIIALRIKLADLVDACQDIGLKNFIIEQVLKAEEDKVNTPDLYKKLISELQPNTADNV